MPVKFESRYNNFGKRKWMWMSSDNCRLLSDVNVLRNDTVHSMPGDINIHRFEELWWNINNIERYIYLIPSIRNGHRRYIGVTIVFNVLIYVRSRKIPHTQALNLVHPIIGSGIILNQKVIRQLPELSWHIISLWHGFPYSTGFTGAEHKSDYNGPPYLALAGGFCGVYSKDFGHDWLPYNGTLKTIVTPIYLVWSFLIDGIRQIFLLLLQPPRPHPHPHPSRHQPCLLLA